jgi:hypothetical protein
MVTALSALDQQMVLPAIGSRRNLQVVINPQLGNIQLYEISANKTELLSITNFLEDLKRIEVSYVPKADISFLQTGGGAQNDRSNDPNYNKFFGKGGIFPSKKTRNADEETLSFRERAFNTEKEWWGKGLRKYDGVVAAAMNKDALVLTIPSYGTILVYRFQNPELILDVYRNFRLDLMIPGNYNSYPESREIYEILPTYLKRQHEKLLLDEENALGDNAGKVVPLGDTDPWMIANQTNKFFLYDAGNNRLLLYQYRGSTKGGTLTLLSSRSMVIDLLIPTAFNSEPSVSTVLRNHNRALKAARRPPIDECYLRAFMELAGVTVEGDSGIHAAADVSAEQLIINHAPQRKVLTYRFEGRNQKLELISVRDYTMEQAVNAHLQSIKNEVEAIKLAKRASKMARRDNFAQVIETARLAIHYDPAVTEELEKSRDLKRLYGENPAWADLLNQGKRAIEEKLARNEAIKERGKQICEERAKLLEDR